MRVGRSVFVVLVLLLFAPLSAAADSAGPRGQDELPTTSARIFLNNLDVEVTYLEEIVARAPQAVRAVRRLAGLYHLRGGYRSDLDEIQRGIDLLDRCLDILSEDPSLLLTRAKLRMSLHRFPQARQDVESAKRRLGPGSMDHPLVIQTGHQRIPLP